MTDAAGTAAAAPADGASTLEAWLRANGAPRPGTEAEDSLVRFLDDNRIGPCATNLAEAMDPRHKLSPRVVVAVHHQTAYFYHDGDRYESSWVRMMCTHDARYLPYFSYSDIKRVWYPFECHVEPWEFALLHPTPAIPQLRVALVHPAAHGVALLVLLGLVSEPVGRQMLLDLVGGDARGDVRARVAARLRSRVAHGEADAVEVEGWGSG